MNNRRFVGLTLGCGLGALALGAVAWSAGLRVNGTESLPPGIWQVFGAAGIAHRGEIVNFCPPDIPALREAKARNYLREGLCPGDFETLFKPVVAVEGDIVTLTDAAVSVNGFAIPNSAPVAADGAGALMPSMRRGLYQVAPGTAWVISSYTPWSFDSRYFGAIELSSVRGQARPIWTFGKPYENLQANIQISRERNHD